MLCLSKTISQAENERTLILLPESYMAGAINAIGILTSSFSKRESPKEMPPDCSAQMINLWALMSLQIAKANTTLHTKYQKSIQRLIKTQKRDKNLQ
jgi:hypothetical protein